MSLFGFIAALTFVVTPKPSKDAFTFILICYAVSTSYIDSLAEGITSIVTKLNERIDILEETGDEKEKKHDESMKVLGIFTGFRGIFQALMILAGGYVAQLTQDSHLLVVGIMLSAYPILFSLQTVFIFKEKKVSSFDSFEIIGAKASSKIIILPQFFLYSFLS